MLKTTDKGQYREITTTAGYVHRLGTDVYAKVAIMMPTDTETDFEEVEERDGYAPSGYEDEVVRLVRQRYDVEAELAILRQRDEKPDEFAEYYAFVEGCKTRAKAKRT
nr:MAG TPA: hypothetical protein [Caudoviricetes sp.]